MANWNDKQWEEFWERCDALELREGESVSAVLALFDVESSMDQYAGTFEEAMELLDRYVAQQEEAELLETCVRLPEAPALAFTYFYSPAGFKWSMTLRAGLTPELARVAMRGLRQEIEMFEKGARAYGWIPANGISPVTAVPAGAQVTTAPRPGAPTLPGGGAPAAPAGAPPPNGGVVKSGTAQLNAVKVDADGKVEFHVEGFRYPLKDSRGPETVAGLFDEGLGWTPEHFVPGAKYEAVDFGRLYVDWEKPSRYYDVVRVHA